LAAFPSALLAASAGASGMAPGKFLPADALGAALSIAEVVVAGYVLGAAYKRAGPWLTAVGVAVLIGLLVAVGRWLRREAKE
jgi:membrane protein DedA with SNARE-associated domain